MSKKTSSPGEEEPETPRSFPGVTASEQFGRQWSATEDLPSAKMFALNLTHRAVEVLHGSREPGQIARWVTEDVFLSIQRYVNAEVRRRSYLPAAARIQKAPKFTLSHMHLYSPRDGVVEVCVLVRQAHRSRTAALRIEGIDSRWRATAFALL
ncbi:MAG: hypothetical protein ACJAV4_001098 [Pontimonas sp.]|jgi:hypothetical protein